MALINRRQAIQWKYPELIHGDGAFEDTKNLGGVKGDYLVQNRNDETGEEEFYWYTTEVSKPTDEDMQTWTNEMEE